MVKVSLGSICSIYIILNSHGEYEFHCFLLTCDHEVVEFRSWEEGAGQKASSQALTSGEQTVTYSEVCLEKSHDKGLWREEGSRKPAKYSRITSTQVHARMQEVRQRSQEACVVKQGTPGKTQT